VRITWQGEPVGYVLVEWIGLVESELCKDHHMDSGEDYHKELFTIDSANIIHEYIEKGDPEFRNVTQMRFEIMDGFFRYEARDSSGGVVKSFMTALSYIHTIETRKDEPSREPGMPMHKLSKEEKRKAR
jgi:hypothetical protein